MSDNMNETPARQDGTTGGAHAATAEATGASAPARRAEPGNGHVDLSRPTGKRQMVDNLVRGLVWIAAAVAIIPLFWILGTVIAKGAPLLFTAEPDYTKICAVEAKAPTKESLDYKRVPASECDKGDGGKAKNIWLSGGKYPAVNDFVAYRPVTPLTKDPNAAGGGGGIVIKGREPQAQKQSVVGIPSSDKAGTVRTASADWWTKDQSATDLREVGGGALHSIIGTLELGLITSLIAVPLGILGAIYLVEYARGKGFSKVVSFMVDILTGVPSIVAALFIYAVAITILGGTRSTMASALALVLLMLPTVLRSTEEMLKLVPDSLREASYALGVPKWKTIMNVVLPTARKGILTGIVLGMARVMGETAPLIILLNYGPRLEWNPTSNNMGSLPTQIMGATEVAANYPGAERGWGAALTLILIVMGLNLIARTVGRSKKSR